MSEQERLLPCRWCLGQPRLTEIKGSLTNPLLVSCEASNVGNCPMSMAMTPEEWNYRAPAPDPAAIAAIRERQKRRYEEIAELRLPGTSQEMRDIDILLSVIDSRPIQRLWLSGECDNVAHSRCPYPDKCTCACHVAESQPIVQDGDTARVYNLCYSTVCAMGKNATTAIKELAEDEGVRITYPLPAESQPTGSAGVREAVCVFCSKSIVHRKAWIHVETNMATCGNKEGILIALPV